jgi:hypothetical protein
MDERNVPVAMGLIKWKTGLCRRFIQEANGNINENVSRVYKHYYE